MINKKKSGEGGANPTTSGPPNTDPSAQLFKLFTKESRGKAAKGGVLPDYYTWDGGGNK